MLLSEVYSAKAVALRQTEDETNKIAFLGAAFFPNDKKMGIDLKMVKTHKGAGVVLQTSAYDALSTVRPRKGFEVTQVEMPLFRESMMIGEREQAEIMRAQESTDPYLDEVLNVLYDDTAELISASELAKEKMRMALLCPEDGNVKISIGGGNAIYNYNYDADGSWKANHYMEIATDESKWGTTTATPITDINAGVDYLRSIGEDPAYLMLNTVTLNAMAKADEIKNALVTITGTPISYIDKTTVKNVVSDKTGLEILIYDKVYKESDSATAVKYMLDGYASILPRNAVGKTFHGVSPEERTLMGDPTVDVAIVNDGVAVAVKTIYGPPAQTETTASMVALPSCEGLDGIYVIKAY